MEQKNKKNTWKKQDVEEVQATEHQGREDTWEKKGGYFLLPVYPLPTSCVSCDGVAGQGDTSFISFRFARLVQNASQHCLLFFLRPLGRKTADSAPFFYTFKSIISIIILITPLFKSASKL